MGIRAGLERGLLCLPDAQGEGRILPEETVDTGLRGPYTVGHGLSGRRETGLEGGDRG